MPESSETGKMQLKAMAGTWRVWMGPQAPMGAPQRCTKR